MRNPIGPKDLPPDPVDSATFAGTAPDGGTRSLPGRPKSGLLPAYPLRTTRLDLRPHTMDDLEDLVRFHSDPEVVRYLPWPVRDRAQTRAALRAKLDQAVLTAPGQWLVLAVEERETAAVVGEVLLKWSNDTARQGELGFVLARSHHGRGYATEAAREVLRLGFDDLGLHRISAVCVDENVASWRLLERLGMRREAHLIHNVCLEGSWASQFVYAIREDGWHADDHVAAGLADDDATVIARMVGRFFGAFESGPGTADRLDALRELFLPTARIARTCGREPTHDDVESFIAPRQALLDGGSLVDFTEWPVAGRVEIFGDVAHWFGSYAKEGVLDGAPYAGRGMKSIQFVRTGDGWRISAAAWDDERDGVGLESYAERHAGAALHPWA